MEKATLAIVCLVLLCMLSIACISAPVSQNLTDESENLGPGPEMPDIVMPEINDSEEDFPLPA
ncbi:MAG: hypothetical protein QW112_03590 [Candidatus Micrarchaeia archaeon]